ncbi:hypothetical protein LXL04_010647 [Taraxacum kok-saghyz]
MNQSEIDQLLRGADGHEAIGMCRSILELSGGTPNESVQISQPINVVAKRHWTPLVEEKPYKVQQFASFESALAYHKEYGRKCGFEIRKATTDLSKGGGGYLRRYIVCNKESEFVDHNARTCPNKAN